MAGNGARFGLFLPLAVASAVGCKYEKIEPKATSDGGARCEVLASSSVHGRIEVTSVVTVPERCDVTSAFDVYVARGGALTLEPGVTLRFAKKKKLEVAGALVVKGTATEAVTITSAEASPAAGDWTGIVFERDPSARDAPPPSSLAHAHVAYAGPSFPDAPSACVAVGDGVSVEITGTTIEHCKHAGLSVHAAQALKRLSASNVRDTETISLELPANALGAVSDTKVGAPVDVHGEVTTAQKWPRLDQPIVVTDRLDVFAALEIADGSTLRFSRDGELAVGSRGRAGTLVARHVTFTVDPPGDGWTGLRFGALAKGSVISGSTVERAGAASGKLAGAAVTFESADARAGVQTDGLVVRETRGRSPDIYVSGAR